MEAISTSTWRRSAWRGGSKKERLSETRTVLISAGNLRVPGDIFVLSLSLEDASMERSEKDSRENVCDCR